MNAREAIDYLTGRELSPSTRDLLALERLDQNPAWIDTPEEAQQIVTEILAGYASNPEWEQIRGHVDDHVDDPRSALDLCTASADCPADLHVSTCPKKRAPAHDWGIRRGACV